MKSNWKLASLIIITMLFVVVFGQFSMTAAQDEMVIAVWSGPEAEALKNLIPEFEEKTGYNVQIEEIGRDAYRTKMTTNLMSGSDSWDAVYLIGEWLPEFAKAGTLMSIEGIIPEETLAKLSPLAPGRFEGTQWGLPAHFHTNYYYYREDLLEEEGLEPAETWEEYLENAKALTKDLDGDGTPDQFGTVMRGAVKKNSVHYEFANYFLAFGAEWLDDDMKPVMNSEEGIEALQFFADLNLKHNVVPPDVSAVGYLEKNQYFQSGRVAQTVQWSAAYNALFSEEQSPDTHDVTGIDILPGRKKGDEIIHGSLATSDSWAIPKTTVNKEGAREFIKFMASEQGAKLWALNGGDPINEAVYSDPEVLEVRPDFEIAHEANKHAKQFPTIPETAELMTIWSQKVGYALQGRIEPEEAMNQCAREWEKVLSEAGYYN